MVRDAEEAVSIGRHQLASGISDVLWRHEPTWLLSIWLDMSNHDAEHLVEHQVATGSTTDGHWANECWELSMKGFEQFRLWV